MTRKTNILILAFLFAYGMCIAQVPTVQDCLGAIPVCQDFYDQDESFSGTGNYPSEIDPFGSSCLTGGEANSVWYIFTVEGDGYINFTLTPDDSDNDYDWSLFNLTGASCEDIFDDASLEISCSSYGLFSGSGPTGISSAEGGTGNSNGPGNTNGPPFNEDVDVVTGETYVLLVQDWSATPDGYTLDFSASTAEIFDSNEPNIESVVLLCDNTIEIEFSENLLCVNLSDADFNLLDSDGISYSPTEIESNCDESSEFASTCILTFSEDLSQLTGEDFTINILESDGNIEDLCGNLAIDLSFDFATNPVMEFDVFIEDAACGENNGSIDFGDISNGAAPYTYEVEGDVQFDPLFSNLPSGEYELIVTDDNGCSVTQTVEIEEIINITYSAGEDDFSCNFDYWMQGTISEEFPITWSTDAAIDIEDVDDLNTQITADETGVYIITLTINQDGCILTDEVEITLSSISQLVTIEHIPCGEFCTGEVGIEPLNGIEPYEITWLDQPSFDGIFSKENLCADIYSYTLTDSNGCETGHTFGIFQPIEPEIISVDIVDETCKGYCDGQLTIHAENATLFGLSQFSFNSEDNVYDNLCDGTYEVIAISDDGCLKTETVTVGTNIPPNANFSVDPLSVSIDEPIFYLENLTEGQFESIWSFGQDDANVITEISFEYLFEDPIAGGYWIELLIIDEAGCTSSIKKRVEIESPFYVYVPNAFSPDADGINDVFFPLVYGHDESYYQMEVFNRWGEIIFYSQDPYEKWLGETKNGEYYSDSEEYFYRLTVKPIYEVEEKEFIGNVLLIR